jgi:glucose-1-phosphate thymidylyltransferase
VKAYLLAAGYATRMYPLTRDCPKPLLEVAGAPILSHILDRILALDDISEVVVIGNDRFAPDFEAWALALEVPVPVRVLNDGSSSDEDKLGAVGDLAFALDRVPTGDEDWLVAAGDNLLAFDLARLQRSYRAATSAEGGHPPLLALRDVKRDGPSAYNEVEIDAQGRVTLFREKPANPRSNLAAIALYFLPPAAVGLLQRYLEEGGEPDAPGHFIAWLVEQVEVRAVQLSGGWFDIGSLSGLAHARANFVP